ncbi:MAG: hypothetical protein LBH73_07720, partial [Spirochaetaceae bacterium]|nr:hypothetical protein [Spirochaetaceae bacterium]
MKRVLIAPGAEEGRGGGHLVRAGTLALELRELGVAAFLCLERPFSRETGRYRQKIPSTLNSGFARSVLAPLGIGEELILPAAECIEKKNAWDLIILDRFRTPPEEYRHWAAAAPVLGIDEGGPLRSSFDFLLDLLPRTETKRPPNWVGPELLRLPEKRRPSFDAWAKPGKFRVLVSFGAEDSAGLALASARILSGLGKESCVEIDLVSPGEAVIPPPIRHRKFVPRLREELASYDLALTHFGLTCFEALYARLPVLLLSPTAYHEKLCKSAALPSLGTGKKGLAAL